MNKEIMSITHVITLISQMSHSQKKWFSLAVAVAVVGLASMLTGCGNRDAERAAVQQKATNEAAAAFMKQGNGHVRKLGGGTQPAAGVSNATVGANDAKK
jgi:hypothetical protein